MIETSTLVLSAAGKRVGLASMMLTFCFATLDAYLEYYYILLDSQPYRYMSEPVLFVFYPYHLFPIIPMLISIAFAPLLLQYIFDFHLTTGKMEVAPSVAQYLMKFHFVAEKKGLFILGLANLLQGLTTLDFFWYALRVLAPSPTDPLAGKWLSTGDWTSLSLGYLNLFGLVIPNWYLATLALTIPVYLAFLISR